MIRFDLINTHMGDGGVMGGEVKTVLGGEDVV